MHYLNRGLVVALSTALLVTAPALAGVKRNYSHAYYTVAHHISKRAAGPNLRRQGATGHRLALELRRLRRVIARAQPAWGPKVMASWYADGGSTACGFHASLGVAHKTLPCGTRVQMQRAGGGPIVTVTVQDRGPFIPGRTWDLNAAAKAALGCSDLCSVHTR